MDTKEISIHLTPSELVTTLNEITHNLIEHDFNDFINLLYKIDVSEKAISIRNPANTKTYVSFVNYLILKREWQKVWLKKTL